MPVRYFSDTELSGWPEQINDDDLVTFFTLSTPDLRWVREQGRGATNLLGLSIQLCTLPWLGFIPDEVSGCPPAALAPVAAALGLDPRSAGDLLGGYGGWEDRTRRDHRGEVLARLGWRVAGSGERKALDEFLRDRALEQDSPSVLLGLARDWLHGERIVRPSVDTLSRRVGAARDAATAETYQRLTPQLQAGLVKRLDGLLELDPGVGMSQLVWLRRGATAATPEVIAAECDKLVFLRALGADRIDLAVLPTARRRRLAEIGKRSTAQAPRRSAPTRRYPVLLATVVHTYTEVLDELVVLFDQALAGADSRARSQLEQRLIAQARAEVDRGTLLDELLEVLADSTIPEGEIGSRIRSRIGMDRLRAAVREPGQRPPRDHGHLDALEARYSYLREFTPRVLARLPLAGGPAADGLLDAVGTLRELNLTGRRRVPEDAHEAFIPTRWRGYLDASRGQGHGGRHRHYWELGVLYRLQTALRSGDVWVPGSRRYPDPAGLLVAPARWATQIDDFCTVAGTHPDPRRQLETKRLQLHTALDQLDHTLAQTSTQTSIDSPTGAGDQLVRLDTHGELVVSPLPAEQLSAEVGALADAAAARLPRIDLPSLLIEVDAWTGFTDALVHAGGAVHRDPELRRNLYAALISQACNLGVAGMAEASGISEDTLAWTTRWYLREDTLRAANNVLVTAHHAHPLAAAWGGGTISSSDGHASPSAANHSQPEPCRGTSSTRAPQRIRMSPTTTPPRSSPRPGGRPWWSSMRSSATPSSCPWPSTPPIPPDRP